jgi:hypothetical protein
MISAHAGIFTALGGELDVEQRYMGSQTING